jgi:hypothetical protein
MGTSLNGLTPAGTYPGLIKTGDNAPIDGTLKTLSDGNGNNLPMEASTTAVNFTGTLTQGGTTLQPTLVSGTNIKTINGASLLGSGDIPVVTSPSGVAGAIQFSNGSAFASDAANLFWDDTNNRLGIGTNAPTAITHIKGVDQLSTSTSLLVQDSIGTNILRVHNQANNSAVVMSTAKIADYEIISGNVLGNTQMRFVPTTGGIAVNKDYSTPAASTLVHIKGSGSTSATTSLLVQNSAGTDLLKVTDDSVTNARGSLNVLHPSVATRSLKLGWGSIFATDSGSELSIGAVLAVPSSPQILLAGNTRSSGANTMQLQASAGVSVASSVTNPNASAQLDVSSTTKGFLPPRMTTTQKNAIATPASGLVVYDSTTNKLCCYDGSTWNDLF